MEAKAPVLLVVLVETSRLRWLVAGIALDGELLPLVCSEDGDLSPYLSLEFDDQVSFLRHRLSGVLQRGCDRLWARRKKPCQLVFVLERPLDQGPDSLTPRVAEHFVEWLSNPPLVFFISESGFDPEKPPRLNKMAGDLEATLQRLLDSRLQDLYTAVDNGLWEVLPKKPYTASPT